MITITLPRVPNVNVLLKKYKRNLPRAFGKAATEAIKIIGDRTEEGIGLEGRFKAYSESYRQHRIERGATTTPNLYYSGDMLGSMYYQTKRNYVEIKFRGKKESKKAYINNKIRPFFGLKREEEIQVYNVFKRWLTK